MAHWNIRRINSKWARGIMAAPTMGDPMRLYPSEDAALLRVAEDLAKLAAVNRVDPEPTATRKGSSIVVTADNVGAVYVINQRP